jgi:hypothetical protein
MPAVARYSPATKELVAELRTRGHKVGCRAVEHWAERGLAPASVRYSLGRRLDQHRRRTPLGRPRLSQPAVTTEARHVRTPIP